MKIWERAEKNSALFLEKYFPALISFSALFSSHSATLCLFLSLESPDRGLFIICKGSYFVDVSVEAVCRE